MDDTNKHLECPACGGADAKVMFCSSNGYPIVRCSHCRLVFTDMRTAPPPSELYPHFDQSDSGVPKVMRSSLGVFTRQREGVVRSVKPRGRLLDFGCGNGAFASWMAQAGYDAVGLEPFSLGRPTEGERLLLIREPLESAAPRLGTFDVITLWHVLEHVPHPVEVLKRLSDLLAPDGVLIVSVPNFQSWQSRVFRGSWFHLDPPRHIIHFEAETLENCLREAHLETTKRWEFLPEYGSSGWLQSTLNQVLPHRNYLYEVVKDRGALKDLGPASHGLHFATSLLMGAPTVAVTMPVEAVASAFGRGAALTFAARKMAAANGNQQS
jgi:SAM-dependent methyltransferase